MEKKKPSTRNLVAIYLSIAAFIIVTFISFSSDSNEDKNSARNESESIIN